MKTILSIAIPLLLTALFLAYLHYKFAIRSWKLIIHAVLFGLLASVPLLLLNEGTILKGIYELRNLKRTGFYSFVVVGFGSELGKFILLRYYFQRQKSFRTAFDGILYALLIGLSFSIVTLPLFMSGWLQGPANTVFLITYPIANIAFAVILGFFVGLGKQRQNRIVDSLTGLGAASFFHGFYFFINLTNEYLIYALFGGGLIVIAGLLFLKSLNQTDDNNQD